MSLQKRHYSNNAIFFQNAFPDFLMEYALTVLDTHYPVSGFIGDGTKGGVRIVDPNMRQSEVRFIHLKDETNQFLIGFPTLGINIEITSLRIIR